MSTETKEARSLCPCQRKPAGEAVWWHTLRPVGTAGCWRWALLEEKCRGSLCPRARHDTQKRIRNHRGKMLYEKTDASEA